MPFWKALVIVIAVAWSTLANADCPSFRPDKYDDIAHELSSEYTVIFTAKILETRYVGKWTGADRLPIEERYEIIERLKGDVSSQTSLRTPCIEEFDCAEAPAAMAKYIGDRNGHKLVVLANRQTDDSGKSIFVASVCPLLFDTDLNSRRGQALAAAIKRVKENR